ncbi:VWA domain-containing protein [Candidatus Acetothermia bacterium]|nr:VWA domain-containing protein [Candidatus Acetothermia bacterium]MBI3643051.1 VWA domain-containing protein [Candidatus Acetothermia bacterium]
MASQSFALHDPLDFFLEFTHLLRVAGLRVGLTETEDAMEAVQITSAPSDWKTALKATLVKRRGDEAIFDRVFDLYFGAWADEQNPSMNQSPPLSQDTSERNLSNAMPKPSENKDQQYQMAIQRAVQFIGRFVFNPARSDNASNLQTAMLLLSQMVSKRTGTAKSLSEIQADLEKAFLQSQEMEDSPNAMRSLVEQGDFEEVDFARMDPSEALLIEEQIEHLIEALSMQLRRRLQRRTRGKIDLRRTIRRSIQFGGVPVRLAYRKRRQDKPKIFVFTDISSSVEAFARFFLMLTRAFQATPITCRSFVFEDETMEVTERLTQEMSRFPRAGQAVERVLTRLRLQGWGMRRSSYGASFRQFDDLAGSEIDRHTTLVILGDARNNYAPPREQILENFQRRAERVIWLNPENRGLWNGGDSVMSTYEPYCDHLYECRTLKHLRKIVDELLKLGDRV